MNCFLDSLLLFLLLFRLGVHLVVRLCVEGVDDNGGVVSAVVLYQVLAQEMFSALVLEAVLISRRGNMY